jgi:hypothetical protein
MKQRTWARGTIDRGNLIWVLLERNPGGLTMVDLVELSGLSRAQIRRSFEWIRDIFAGEQDQPIIYLPGKHRNVYKLNQDALESDEDLRRRVQVWAIQIRRARTAVAQPSIAKFGQSAGFRRLNRHMAMVEEDLRDLLDDIGGTPPLLERVG